MIIKEKVPKDCVATLPIDAILLNNELAAALGGWCNGWSASHNAYEAIVTLDETRVGDAVLVRNIITSHIANIPIREKQKEIDKEIVQIEQLQTPRVLREAALGNRAKLQEIENLIEGLRTVRRSIK